MTTTSRAIIALILGGYLVGSIPFGLIVGWLKGVDVRTAGSKNIGATNVGRLLGRPFGVLVFLLDAAKGFAPTLIAGWLLTDLAPKAGLSITETTLIQLAVALVCVLGHNYPLYLRFRGGKGVSTALGATLGVYPDLTYAALAAFVIWLAVVAIWRYVSLGSIVAAVAFPLMVLLINVLQGRPPIDENWPVLAFSLLAAVMIVLRHRVNLARLRAGTELRIGQKPASLAQPAATDISDIVRH